MEPRLSRTPTVRSAAGASRLVDDLSVGTATVAELEVARLQVGRPARLDALAPRSLTVRCGQERHEALDLLGVVEVGVELLDVGHRIAGDVATFEGQEQHEIEPDPAGFGV